MASIPSGGGGLRLESYAAPKQSVQIQQRSMAKNSSEDSCPECGIGNGCGCLAKVTMGKAKCDGKWGEGGAVPEISRKVPIIVRAKPMPGTERSGINYPPMGQPSKKGIALGQNAYGFSHAATTEEVTSLLRSLEKALADVAAAADGQNAPACVRDIMAGSYLLAKKTAEKMRNFIMANVPKVEWLLTDGEAAVAGEVLKCAATLQSSSTKMESDDTGMAAAIALGLGALVLFFVV